MTEYPARKIVIHRTIAQDDLVFLHVEERLGGSVTVARGELFRTQGNKIAEHWSSHVIDETHRRNGNTTFGGPDVNVQKSFARKYAKRFEDIDRRVWNDWDFDAVFKTRTERYIQHSPTGKDTAQGLIDALQSVKQLGIRMSAEVKHTIAEGDFLVSHRLYRTNPPYPEFRTINVFDLFRINGDGKADEHWDIIEEVACEEHLQKLF